MASSWSVGDACYAVWGADMQWYPARIERVQRSEDGAGMVYTVRFDNYDGGPELVGPECLWPMDADAAAAAAAAGADAAPAAAAEGAGGAGAGATAAPALTEATAAALADSREASMADREESYTSVNTDNDSEVDDPDGLLAAMAAEAEAKGDDTVSVSASVVSGGGGGGGGGSGDDYYGPSSARRHHLGGLGASQSVLSIAESEEGDDGQPAAPAAAAAAAAAPAAPMTRSERRTRIVRELIETEESYVSSLKRLAVEYNDPLAAAVGTGDEVLSADQVDALFSNVNTLIRVNETLLGDLLERAGGDRWDADVTCLGDLFKNLMPFMRMYTAYVSNHDKATQVLHRAHTGARSLSAFRDFLRAKEASGGGVGQLQSLLIMPIQRIPRYRMLLADLVKHTDEEHPDHPALVSALELVASVAAHINAEVAEQANRAEIRAIEEQFWGNRSFVAPGRRYIMSGPLVKLSVSSKNEGASAKKKRQHYRFFLFSDLLVYATDAGAGGNGKRGGGTLNRIGKFVSGAAAHVSGFRYRLHKELPIDSRFSVFSIPDFPRRIMITSSVKNFVVEATSAEERERWFKALEAQKSDFEDKDRSFKSKRAAASAKTPGGGFSGGGDGDDAEQHVQLPMDAVGAITCCSCKSTLTEVEMRHVWRCYLCDGMACNRCALMRVHDSTPAASDGGTLKKPKPKRTCQSCVAALRERHEQGVDKHLVITNPPTNQQRTRQRSATLTRKSRLTAAANSAFAYLAPVTGGGAGGDDAVVPGAPPITASSQKERRRAAPQTARPHRHQKNKSSAPPDMMAELADSLARRKQNASAEKRREASAPPPVAEAVGGGGDAGSPAGHRRSHTRQRSLSNLARFTQNCSVGGCGSTREPGRSYCAQHASVYSEHATGGSAAGAGERSPSASSARGVQAAFGAAGDGDRGAAAPKSAAALNRELRDKIRRGSHTLRPATRPRPHSTFAAPRGPNGTLPRPSPPPLPAPQAAGAPPPDRKPPPPAPPPPVQVPDAAPPLASSASAAAIMQTASTPKAAEAAAGGGGGARRGCGGSVLARQLLSAWESEEPAGGDSGPLAVRYRRCFLAVHVGRYRKDALLESVVIDYGGGTLQLPDGSSLPLRVTLL